MYTESELKKHLSSGKFSNLYLVFGEEKMLVKNSTELIVKKISGGELNDFNYHVFTGECTPSEVSVCADILPFMGGVNIVRLVDIDFDKLPAEDFKLMMKIFESLPQSTVAVIAMPTLEITSKTAKAQFKKLIALADKKGVCVELSHRTGLALERDLCKWAKAGGCSMTELTAHRLIQYVGEDLNRLNTEMKKLTAYADGREITPEMIELLVHKTVEASVYDLFGFIIGGNTDRAMEAVSVLFYEQVNAVAICSALSNAYIDAYRARVGSDAGRSSSQTAADFVYKNRAWVLDKVKRQISSVNTSSLRRSIDVLVDTQSRLLSETVDERVETERLICRLAVIAGDRLDD